eukprot:CAMPEP_0117607490 /NCGR_PEP_ID=MMETSP0784-20121206/80288_1 /TAXON_ID=39447 /ORGANISM="" /LENGTH=100 /DNA_ID=CAMNT_0005410671 /DNA_START=234 /DNA_END=533 /DNA_ORIENTATION=+
MRQVERMHELPDDHFGVLLRGLQGVHHLVDFGGLQPGLCEGSRLRGRLLPLTETLFSLPPTALLSLAPLTIAFRELHHDGNAPFLLEAQQFLRKLVQRLR